MRPIAPVAGKFGIADLLRFAGVAWRRASARRLAAIGLVLAIALAVGSARAEAVPDGAVAALLDPLGTILPARPEPEPGSASPASCLLDRDPRRTCRVPAPRLRAVPGGGGRSGSGLLLRYAVEVERGVGVDAGRAARAIEAILGDSRGWSGGGRVAFRRVGSPPVDFTIVLATPASVDRLCAPLSTDGVFSCGLEGRAVLNLMRWRHGARAFGGDLAAYRRYLVNHEVGHVLGHGHASCPGPGAPAPVMMQQTIRVGDCRPNGWPLPWERG